MTKMGILEKLAIKIRAQLYSRDHMCNHAGTPGISRCRLTEFLLHRLIEEFLERSGGYRPFQEAYKAVIIVRLL